mmetsp:Transcript_17127/g.49513  ORF Transcript_17127/g.49513 Transcript_17127/m.49513 type:complete len:310 (-) Transcript_17127:1090-2019(-)
MLRGPHRRRTIRRPRHPPLRRKRPDRLQFVLGPGGHHLSQPGPVERRRSREFERRRPSRRRGIVRRRGRAEGRPGGSRSGQGIAVGRLSRRSVRQRSLRSRGLRKSESVPRGESFRPPDHPLGRSYGQGHHGGHYPRGRESSARHPRGRGGGDRSGRGGSSHHGGTGVRRGARDESSDAVPDLPRRIARRGPRVGRIGGHLRAFDQSGGVQRARVERGAGAEGGSAERRFGVRPVSSHESVHTRRGAIFIDRGAEGGGGDIEGRRRQGVRARLSPRRRTRPTGRGGPGRVRRISKVGVVRRRRRGGGGG